MTGTGRGRAVRPGADRRLATARQGEDAAAAHLAQGGCRILARNYRCVFGEMDIVARDGTTLVFAEVKSRRTETYGDPQLAVGKTKQRKMTQIARQYLQAQGMEDRPARFDVIAVRLLPGETRIEWIQNAFEPPADA